MLVKLRKLRFRMRNRQMILRIVAKASVVTEQLTGCPAEVSAAQALLESSWLARMPGNNCFGIKNSDRFPSSRYTVTHEFINGTWEQKTHSFEVYPTLEDCFTDHAKLITGGFTTDKPNCYAPGFEEYRKDKNLMKWVNNMAIHYATDPYYSTKLFAIMQGMEFKSILKETREMYG
jgi:flagellum-specific peptidoglycan hydrolase FlgJ